MNAYQFIKDNSFLLDNNAEDLHEIINCAGEYKYFCLNNFFGHSYANHEAGVAVSIAELKQAIADYEMVDSYGGMTMAKRQLNLFLRVNNERGTEPSIRVTNLKHAIERIENNKGGAA